MAVEELLREPRIHADSAAAEVDPLLERDALQETQLLDVRVHSLSSAVGLLFELRTALQFEAGGAGVLVVRGLREFHWRAAPVESRLTAWTVVGSEPKREAGTFSLKMDCYPQAALQLCGASAEFYVIDVPGIGETPPDYTDADERTIESKLVGWSAPFSLLQATSL